MSPQFCYTVSIGPAPKREVWRSYVVVSGVDKDRRNYRLSGRRYCEGETETEAEPNFDLHKFSYVIPSNLSSHAEQDIRPARAHISDQKPSEAMHQTELSCQLKHTAWMRTVVDPYCKVESERGSIRPASCLSTDLQGSKQSLKNKSSSTAVECRYSVSQDRIG
jgi:hypothetical protein